MASKAKLETNAEDIKYKVTSNTRVKVWKLL